MTRDRRDEINKYEADVYYEAWRRNENPDRAVDCAQDCYWEGHSADECVDGYQRRRARREKQEQEQWPEEQWPEEQAP